MNILLHLLLYNLVISILLYGSLAYNPRMWLHRMPAGVVAKVPPRTAYEKRQLLIVAVPFLAWLVGYPIFYTLSQDADWLHSFLILCAFLAGFALWDTLVLDLLIFCKITPSWIVISGTTRQDYAETKYHLVSGAKGLAMSLVFSGILATIRTLVHL